MGATPPKLIKCVKVMRRTCKSGWGLSDDVQLRPRHHIGKTKTKVGGPLKPPVPSRKGLKRVLQGSSSEHTPKPNSPTSATSVVDAAAAADITMEDAVMDAADGVADIAVTSHPPSRETSPTKAPVAPTFAEAVKSPVLPGDGTPSKKARRTQSGAQARRQKKAKRELQSAAQPAQTTSGLSPELLSRYKDGTWLFLPVPRGPDYDDDTVENALDAFDTGDQKIITAVERFSNQGWTVRFAHTHIAYAHVGKFLTIKGKTFPFRLFQGAGASTFRLQTAAVITGEEIRSALQGMSPTPLVELRRIMRGIRMTNKWVVCWETAPLNFKRHFSIVGCLSSLTEEVPGTGCLVCSNLAHAAKDCPQTTSCWRASRPPSPPAQK